MTAKEVLAELKRLGSAQTKKTLMRHGAREPLFGVKVEHLKKIQKRLGADHRLAMALFATGNSDAMYLAGLIAEPEKMTKADLNRWIKAAYWPMLSESTVASVAAESPHGWDLALEWIESKREIVAAAGWATLSSLVALKKDTELDLGEVKKLIARVGRTLALQPDRVRYCMNGYLIAAGGYVPAFTEMAIKTGEKLGRVKVDMGDTACKVPHAPDYIRKMQDRGVIGKKRESVRC